MHWRIRAVLDWFARPFRPDGWCDRCSCVHQPSKYVDLESEIVASMAKQLAEDIDREILAELEELADCPSCLRGDIDCPKHGPYVEFDDDK